MNGKGFLILCLCWGWSLLSVQAQENKIAYGKHFGKAELKTDLRISGSFQYKYVKTGLPHYLVEDDEIGEEKKIDLPMFRKLTIYGGESFVTARPDTTDYVWVDSYDDLLRVVRKGKLTLYDNSKIVDENYKLLDRYTMVAEHDELGTKVVKKIANLEDLMTDRPYFIASAKATGKFESRDFGVILYLVDLYNDKDPMRTIQWKEVKIRTIKGEEYEGQGHIQPMDVRNEYNTSASAYVHFYKDGEFKLFRHDQIVSLELDGEVYESGYYGLTNKYFFGKKWEHEDFTYLVAPKIVNRNNYFYINRDMNEQDYIILRESAGTYLKPENEAALRKRFFNVR